jgi:hypothetical protein
MVALKTALMSSLKSPPPTVKTTTQCVSEAFFAPQKGARYLNPQTGLWLSTDPAMGEYVPQAPINDEAKRYNQNLPGMGGVFNVVNLHVYHYAGNNPVKYVDPDGNSAFHVELFQGTSGFGHEAPQSIFGYFNKYDEWAQIIFSIHGTEFKMDNGSMRLWKGDYGKLRQYLPAEMAQFVGGSGGEIGFYNPNGTRMSRFDLFFKLGVITSEMNLFEKGTGRKIAGYKEYLSFWTTSFSWFENLGKDSLYSVNTIGFTSERAAIRFEEKLRKSADSAKSHPFNENESIKIERNGKTVTVTWGQE